MLFYGPSGAGKKTRISCTLRQLFGPGVEKVLHCYYDICGAFRLTMPLQLKIDQRVFLTPSKRKVEVNIVQSNYHLEITPRCVRDILIFETGHSLRHYLITVKQGITIGSSSRNFSKRSHKHNRLISAPNRDSKVYLVHETFLAGTLTRLPPTVVIINEADSLSRDAQAALRRTMEKYMTNLRIILCANSTSRLIAPIKSRCLLMRVAAPSREEVPFFRKVHSD